MVSRPVVERQGRDVLVTQPGGGCWVFKDPVMRGGRPVALVRFGPVSGDETALFGSVDLVDPRATVALVRAVGRRFNQPGLEVSLSEAVDALLQSMRTGSPTVVLADVQPSVKPRWILPGLVDGTGPTSIVSSGGSGKSLFALAVAAAVAADSSSVLGIRPEVTGPVLFVDWESDEHVHAERLRAIAAGSRIAVPRGVLYRRMAAPLAAVAEVVSRDVEREGIVLVMHDSLMLARGGDAFGPEGTILLYEALRDLGAPSFLSDHKSKEATRSGQRGGYGSIVNENTARLVWEFKKIERPRGGIAIVLERHKANHVGFLPPLGFQVDFESAPDGGPTRVAFRRVEPESITQALPETDSARVVSLLDHAGVEGMLVASIAGELGIPESQVRARLNDLKERGEAHGDGARPQRWFAASTSRWQRLDDAPALAPYS